MPRVTFLPNDVTVEVPAGTLLHEAAMQAGVENLHLPCGAQGTCGQCLVEVVGPEPARAGLNLVMACQTKVQGDLVIRLPEDQDVAMQVVGDSQSLLGDKTLPRPADLRALYRIEQLTVPPASIEEHYSDWLRLARTLGGNLTTDLPVLRKLAAALREQDGTVSVALDEIGSSTRVLDVWPGRVGLRPLGLAIDIGTTTVAVQLVDLGNGTVLDTATSYNQQIRRGVDIITRIDYARSPERLEELRDLIVNTLNGLIGELTRSSGRAADEIHAAFVAGNTTMIHLLLGLPPRHIRETPYVPTVNPVPPIVAREVGLAIHPSAMVHFAPGVGSYVGGDITAGLLTTDFLTEKEQVFLYLDIGTNGEIVVGNADWMVGCACSAGPAFEGSGIKCGMRATHGAIEYVQIGERGSSVRYKVIGGGKPAGICGSGLICLLGELFVRRVVDQAGRFNPDQTAGRVVESEHGRGFVLESGAGTATGEDLIITEADIENLIRTKAAIYAACDLILENVGLSWEAISRVYIAGGFGRYIQVSDAVLIGMLPDIEHQKFRYIGNAALTGAYIALLSRAHRQQLGELASRMTYVDLSSDSHYMDSYVKALFLPHTEMRQFPGVARKLACSLDPSVPE
jgi:uncharacterized 2Fe-2S/4Fe-4S cluster protein (DUF4445 family)